MKRRSGNLLMTIAVTFFATLMIFSMISITHAQKSNAKNKAIKATDIDNYIAFANLYANAFKDDLSGMNGNYYMGSLSNVDGTSAITIDTYNSIVSEIQGKLQLGSYREDKTWQYKLTDPKAALSVANLYSNPEIKEIADDLLEDASLLVTVKSDLHVSAIASDSGLSLDYSDSLYFDDIDLKIIIEKGTVQLIQEYKLTGVILNTTYNPDNLNIYYTISIDRARCILESQLISKNNKEKLT